MNFVKICPECNKSYTNGAIGKCGKCQRILRNITYMATKFTRPNIVAFIYVVEPEVKEGKEK